MKMDNLYLLTLIKSTDTLAGIAHKSFTSHSKHMNMPRKLKSSSEPTEALFGALVFLLGGAVTRKTGSQCWNTSNSFIIYME